MSNNRENILANIIFGQAGKKLFTIMFVGIMLSYLLFYESRYFKVFLSVVSEVE